MIPLRWIVALAAVASITGSATANPVVTLTLDSAANNGGYVVQFNNGNGGAPTLDYSFGGILNFTAVPGGAIQTFCIERTQDVFFHQPDNTFQFTTTNIGDLHVQDIPQSQVPGPGMGPEKASALLRLYQQHYFQVLASTPSDLSVGAAFQLAVWEIVNDYTEGGSNHDLHLNAGIFQASGGAATLAQGWLDNIGNIDLDPLQDPDLYLIGYTSTSAEDQIALNVALETIPNVVTPEPTTAVLCVIGLAGICTAGYRRRKQNAA